MSRHEIPEGMQLVGDILAPIVERLNPHRVTPIYKAHGNRVLNRAGVPHWMTIEQAEAEGRRLTASLFTSEDPGEVLPLVTQLAWAIRDAREAGSDPTPPPAANAPVPQEQGEAA